MASSIGLYYAQSTAITNSENQNKWNLQFVKALKFRLEQLSSDLKLHTHDLEKSTPQFNEDILIFIHSSFLFENKAFQVNIQKAKNNHFFIFNHPFNKGDFKDLSISKSYSFFYLNNETELIFPLSLDEGTHIQQLFWSSINDLARDVLLFFQKSNSTKKLPKIYLATTSEDIVEFRAMIKRELEEYGFEVVPKENFPFNTVETMSSINDLLVDCQLSIHLIGSLFEEKLDDDSLSLSFLQNTIASEKSNKTDMRRLIWFPPQMLIEDERQEDVVKYIRHHPKAQYGAEIFEAPIEELKFAVHEQMESIEIAGKADKKTEKQQGENVLYVICNEGDVEKIKGEKNIFGLKKNEQEKYEVRFPNFSLRGTSFRTKHIEMLKTCDAAIIYYDTGSINWLDTKLNDFLKISGYGRQKPWKMQALFHRKPIEKDYSTHFSKLKVVKI